MTVRERGGQDAAIQIAGLADADAVAVQLGAATTAGGEQFVADRIVNHTHFGAALDAQGDGDGNVGNTLDEVGGAIQWVNDPLIVGTFQTLNAELFTDDAVVGIGLQQGADYGLFCFTIDVGYQIVFCFLGGLNVGVITKILGDNLTSTTGRTNGNVQHGMHKLTHQMLKNGIGKSAADYTRRAEVR